MCYNQRCDELFWSQKHTILIQCLTDNHITYITHARLFKVFSCRPNQEQYISSNLTYNPLPVLPISRIQKFSILLCNDKSDIFLFLSNQCKNVIFQERMIRNK